MSSVNSVFELPDEERMAVNLISGRMDGKQDGEAIDGGIDRVVM
jgi:hypothetical protein